MNILKYKNYYIIFSIISVVVSILLLILFRLNVGIDFTGGTLIELSFKEKITKSAITQIIKSTNIEVASINTTSTNTFLIRTKPLDDQKKVQILKKINEKYKSSEEIASETVGPVIGSELLQKAILSVIVATIAIILYIAWAFRSVPKPASAWRFGITTVAALLHDIIFVLGIFALFGKFFGAQIDSFFITAVLTVIGFSVHDTIVVFDRIRENLKAHPGENFTILVNNSLVQTMTRSLNTSITVVLVLLALLLFGGSSMRWLTVALLAGIVVGTYSSIFLASPLLVIWQEWQDKKNIKSN